MFDLEYNLYQYLTIIIVFNIRIRIINVNLNHFVALKSSKDTDNGISKVSDLIVKLFSNDKYMLSWCQGLILYYTLEAFKFNKITILLLHVKIVSDK